MNWKTKNVCRGAWIHSHFQLHPLKGLYMNALMQIKTHKISWLVAAVSVSFLCLLVFFVVFFLLFKIFVFLNLFTFLCKRMTILSCFFLKLVWWGWDGKFYQYIKKKWIVHHFVLLSNKSLGPVVAKLEHLNKTNKLIVKWKKLNMALRKCCLSLAYVYVNICFFRCLLFPFSL